MFHSVYHISLPERHTVIGQSLTVAQSITERMACPLRLLRHAQSAFPRRKMYAHQEHNGFCVVCKARTPLLRFAVHLLDNLSYSHRLSQLGLLSLESRRIMADLTTCYKLLNDQIDVNCSEFFTVSTLTHT